MWPEDALAGFRWPVMASRRIAADPQQVWSVISAPGNLERCHPFCKTNPVTEWPGPNSRDRIEYLNGWVFERQFRGWIDGVGYDLEIGPPGKSTSYVRWRLEAPEPASCDLKITVYPIALQRIPTAIRWLPHLLRLRPMLRSYLESVVRGFEWAITRDEPVPRNQFGVHPWFSG